MAYGLVLPSIMEYGERIDRPQSKAEALLDLAFAKAMAPFQSWRADALHKILAPVNAAAAAAAGQSTDQLVAGFRHLCIELRRTDLADDAVVARTLALLREIVSRVLGQRPHDVQILGAFSLLRGMVAEMAPGEGKTLTAALASATAAGAGIPVHVVTVNDYLARRDAEATGPLYRCLGLSVGIAVSGQDFAERQAAYRSNVAYCTNKELAFDYLRDRMALGRHSGAVSLKLSALESSDRRARGLRLRGLHFAIVDEADSVLIDEARTPLIISGQSDSAVDGNRIALALKVATELKSERDYRIAHNERRVTLTSAGRTHVDQRLGGQAGPLRSPVVREELIRQALSALHLFKVNEDYLIRDGKLLIIDEFTGRVMKDRTWSDGLHQMIEAKEGCPLSAPRSTIARMTYQRFFRRYRRLAGLTGTASNIGAELWSIYRLSIASIPTHRPLLRRTTPDRVYATQADKAEALLARICELHARGAPVLVGTRSVAASEAVSTLLSGAKLDHVVLNAAQDDQEAAIVARAGERGRITVVTNMAGRGTDIKLAEGVPELGGLHVIMTERHEARRIDDQLAGRCARQGDPGVCEAMLSLEDPLLTEFGSTWLRTFAARAMALFGPVAGQLMLRLAQYRAEQLHAHMRWALFRSDQTLDRTLAFSGRRE